MKSLGTPIEIERHDEVDSTSLLARRAIAAGEVGGQPRMIIARRQLAGVGRFGRSWASPEGGLWCTLVWPLPRESRPIIEGLGLRVGLACAHAVEHKLAAHGRGDDVQLKWPNDVLAGGKKVAGVLCEVVAGDTAAASYALIGVGVNGNFAIDDLPAELRHSATTLSTIVGGDVKMDRLLDDLLCRLCDALMVEGLPAGALHDIRHRLFGVGAPVQITLPDGSSRRGRLIGMTDEGRLRLDTVEGDYQAPITADVFIEYEQEKPSRA